MAHALRWHLVVAAAGVVAAAREAAVTDVEINLGAPSRPLEHFWKASAGSGHAMLGLRTDWQQQLAAVHRDLGINGVRFHGTFDDDMGPVVTGSADAPVYNFTLINTLYDAIRHAGVTPIVELSFMPRAIANCTDKCPTTMKYRGVTAPPVRWEAWHDLVAALARNFVERYGLDVVATFKFEVWNELWGMPWGDGSIGGSPYMAMYNASYHALKGVSPRLQVGGPATMEVQHVSDFVSALKEWKIDADFVSTHLYPTDWCNSAPDARVNLDCFTDAILGAREQAKGYPFLMTEYNCGWKNTEIHDGESRSYAAAFALRTVNALKGAADALSWWTFSSIFEEGGLPTNEFGPFGANSAMQSVHGVPMPVYRGFELLRTAGNATVPVVINGATAANGTDTTLSVMATVPGQGSSSGDATVYFANFAPDDGRGAMPDSPPTAAASSSAPAPAVAAPCDPSGFLKDTDFPGGDLLPESQKFSTPNASACCEACKNFPVDKFCAAWSWGVSGRLKRCYLKKDEAVVNKKPHAGFTAGFPGNPPPPPSNNPWYNTTRVVRLSVDASRLLGGGAAGGGPVATVSTVNSTCANPKALWLAMGSPTWPSSSQLAQLQKASETCVEQVALVVDASGKTSLTLSLEAYAAVSVSLPLVGAGGNQGQH